MRNRHGKNTSSPMEISNVRNIAKFLFTVENYFQTSFKDMLHLGNITDENPLNS